MPDDAPLPPDAADALLLGFDAVEKELNDLALLAAAVRARMEAEEDQRANVVPLRLAA